MTKLIVGPKVVSGVASRVVVAGHEVGQFVTGFSGARLDDAVVL